VLFAFSTGSSVSASFQFAEGKKRKVKKGGLIVAASSLPQVLKPI